MKKQKGFSVVEILLILVVIGLIGTVGGLVYDRQRVEIGSQAKPNTVKTKTIENINNTATNIDTGSQNQAQYLMVKEWGVKIPFGDSASLSYEVKDINTVRVRSAELDKVSASGCGSNSVTVVRGIASNVVPGTVNDPNGLKFLDLYNDTTVNNSDLSERSIKAKVGEYYYLAPGYSLASCVYSGDASDLITESDAMVKIVRSINRLTTIQ